MENLVIALIAVHAGMGGIALLSGLISIIAPKGKRLHRQAGKCFYYTLLATAVSAMLIAVLPGHQNSFLFSIGIFSAYLVLMGYRAIGYKAAKPRLGRDKLIAGSMLVSGLAMIVLPLVGGAPFNVVLTVFAGLAIIFSLGDLSRFRKPERLRQQWLPLHISKITGAYIATVTGFVVVNGILPGLLAWFAPTVLGSLLISYWIWRVSKPQPLARH